MTEWFWRFARHLSIIGNFLSNWAWIEKCFVYCCFFECFCPLLDCEFKANLCTFEDRFQSQKSKEKSVGSLHISFRFWSSLKHNKVLKTFNGKCLCWRRINCFCSLGWIKAVLTDFINMIFAEMSTELSNYFDLISHRNLLQP